MDERDADISEGRTYINKEECKIALAIHAIRNMFHFVQSRTRKNSFVVSCSDIKCGWRVNAKKMKENEFYQITKIFSDHTCNVETRSKFAKKATYKVIASLYKARFGDIERAPKPKELQQIVMEDMRVSTNYLKCWRAKTAANDSVRGTEEEAYLHLEEYLHMLKLANLGTRTKIKTIVDEEGYERFLYMYLAFGASITGFHKLRCVLVINGTHLIGKYKGVLLTASGQDANFQVFPLAFVVVDIKNDKAWEWFLNHVKVVIGDSPNLAIISDRHKSILKATKIVYPLARHGACVIHLAQNVVGRYKSKGLAKLVVRAAYAYKPGHCDDVLKQIKGIRKACGEYLEKYGKDKWARAYFKTNRYNLMTSNIVEALNNALEPARSAPIIELLMFIQSMMTRWFSARRKKAACHKSVITPEVDKQIAKNYAAIRATKVINITGFSFEVHGLFGQKHKVDLSAKTCTCRCYDKLKIPCGHAVVAANSRGLWNEPLAGTDYKTTIWADTYKGVIQPHKDPKDNHIPDEIKKQSYITSKHKEVGWSA